MAQRDLYQSADFFSFVRNYVNLAYFSGPLGIQIESRRDPNLKMLEKLSDFMNFFDLFAKAVVTRYVGKQTLGVRIITRTPGITYNKKTQKNFIQGL